jgi:hypothetical protein
MQCYVCAEAGKQTEAVGICIVCGMGLCMDHVLREDVGLWEGGYPFPKERAKKKLPRILCAECKEVLVDNWEGDPRFPGRGSLEFE